MHEFLSNFLKPGIGANIVENTKFDPSTIQAPSSPLDILTRMVPTNPIEALATADMLGIIFFAIFFGIVLNMIDKEKSLLLKNIVDSIAAELNWGAEKLRDDITCLALDLKNTELVKKIKKKTTEKSDK